MLHVPVSGSRGRWSGIEVDGPSLLEGEYCPACANVQVHLHPRAVSAASLSTKSLLAVLGYLPRYMYLTYTAYGHLQLEVSY